MSDDLDFDMEVVKNEDLGSSETDSDPNSGESDRPGIEKLDGERAESSGDKRRIGRKESTGSSSSATDAVEEKRGSSGEPQGPELIDGVLWSKINYVPDGWDLVNLGPEVSIQTGYNAPSENFVDKGGIPLIRNRDLGSSQTEIQYDGDYGDEYLIEEGDLLVSMDGEFEPHLWTGGKALLNQRVCKVEGSESFNHIFLTYAIEKPLYLLQKSIAGTTVKHLSKSNIRSVNLPTPPLPEQRKIASVLYTVDQAIQKTEEIIEQEERIYEGTKRDLLRRGYFDHSGTQNTATGSYPDEWRIARGDEIFSLRSGEFLDSSKRKEDGEYPVYGGNGIMGYTDQSRVPEGIVVIGRVGAYCGNVHITESRAWVTDNAILVEDLSTGMKPGFLVHVLDEVGLNRFAEQSAQPRISQSTLRNLKLPIPPQEEQEKIVGSLSTIREARENEKELHELLRSLKKGLMPDLLTGDVRTADKAIEVLEEVQAHG